MIIDTRREIRRLMGRLEVSTWKPLVTALACAAIAWGVAHGLELPGLQPAARWSLFIMVLAAGLWVTEAIPAFAVGILVIGLQIAILGRPGGVFATDADDWKMFIEPWGSPLIWLFFSGFVLARAISNSGLDTWFSMSVLRRFGTRPRSVLLGSMCVTFGFSMFASNTATSAMMVAVLTPVVASMKDDPFAKALLVGVAFAANIGGMATLIGTPPNAIAAGQLASVEPIGFARWMVIGGPPAVLLLLVAWWFLMRRFPTRVARVDLSMLGQTPADKPRMKRWRRLVVLAGVLLTVGLWLTEPLHGISATVVAFVPVTIFTFSQVLRSGDIRSLEWDVLLLLAGGLSLGVGVSQTGLAGYLVEKLPLDDASPLAIAFLLAGATAVLSNFMSNTATANIVVPMAIAVAGSSAGPVVVPIALSASVAMCLPVSTPPNAIAFSSGHLQTRDFIAGGVLLGVLGTVVSVLWSAIVLGDLGSWG